MFDVNVANQIGLFNSPTTQSRMGKPDLTQADFLRLMTEQLKNQDPLKPLTNAEFVSQMAQMSTSQGVDKLNTAMSALADSFGSDMALRAAPLIGREAMVSTDRLALGDAGASGVAASPGAGTITVSITDGSGQLVRRMQVAANGTGDVPFTWDGINQNGQRVANGTYRVTATFGSGRDAQAVEVGAYAPIESVTLSSQGLILNLTGLGPAPLSAVRRLG